jgi:type IV pilus assembly protein PilC
MVKNSLTQGLTIAEAMKKKPQSFPSLLRREIAVGEDTGNLDKTLESLSQHYQKKFTDIIKNVSALIEPVLLVVISVVIGAILISIVVPIYQIIGQLNPS